MVNCKQMSTIERVSRNVVKNNAEDYLKYHNEFKKKGLCTKLFLVCKNLWVVLFYKYLASESDKATFRGLVHYLKKKV